MTENQLATGQVSSEQMRAAGFEWDPSHQGYARWTHMGTGVTALRQPYMDEKEWAAHQRAKIEEAAAQERPVGKLTPTQEITLRAIGDGTLLGAPKRTTESLIRRGLIRPHEQSWLLTPKGRKLIEGYK
ncbi:MAG: hypothetical protein RB191_02285 [Terriglobia bacterium]|nr:hypothetical protein [Terriglobia bacterium]